MIFKNPEKYKRFIIEFIISLIAGITVKTIWVAVHQPIQAPSIRLLAVWLPLQFVAFSFYYFYLESRFGSSESLRQAQRRDGYTHLGWIIVFLLEIGYADIGPWQLWFGIIYITILIIKLVIVIHFWLNSKNPPNDKSGNYPPKGKDIFIVLFFLYFFISPWAVLVSPPDGDEPYILLITHSLYHDHDINLYNNLIHNDYLKISPLIPHNLVPQPHDISLDGYYRSHHLPVFPSILVPGYAIAGRLGVLWEMNFFTALLMAILYSLSCRLVPSQKGALLGTLCVALSSPIVIYSGLAYREIIVSLCLMILLYQARKIYTHETKRWFSLPFLVVFLLLLGPRYAIPTLPFIAYLFITSWRNNGKKKFLVYSILGMSVVVFMGGYYLFFQKSFLLKLMVGDFVTLSNFPSNFVGLFFDQQWGLFFIAPIYLLLFIGAGVYFEYSKSEALLLFCMCIPYILFVSAFVNAFGWASPAPRYLVCILPIAGIFLSALFSKILNVIAIYFISFLGLLTSIITFAHIMFPATRQNLYHSMKNQIFSELGVRLHADLGRFFPSFLRWNDASTLFPIFTLLILMIIFFQFRKFVLHNGNHISEFQPLYFSFITIGFFTLLINTAIYKPLRVVEMEDRENVYSNLDNYYPSMDNVLTQFQNNEENFGLNLHSLDTVKTIGYFPKGWTEITLLSKSSSLHDVLPFVWLNLNGSDFGQTEIVGSRNWQENTFISQNTTGWGTLLLNYINEFKDSISSDERKLYLNKILLNPAHVRINQTQGKDSHYVIQLDGDIPSSTRVVSFKTQLIPGDYIAHFDINSEMDETYELYFAVKLNSHYLGRIYNDPILKNTHKDYWVHIDSPIQDIQLIFSDYVFRDIPSKRVDMPVDKITFVPVSQFNYSYQMDTVDIFLYQCSQQVMAYNDKLSLSIPNFSQPMIGIIWLKGDTSLDNWPLNAILQDSKQQEIGRVSVTKSEWTPYLFKTNLPVENNYLTISMDTEISNNRNVKNSFLYIHKVIFAPYNKKNWESANNLFGTKNG